MPWVWTMPFSGPCSVRSTRLPPTVTSATRSPSLKASTVSPSSRAVTPLSASRSRLGNKRTSGAPSSRPGLGRSWLPCSRGRYAEHLAHRAPGHAQNDLQVWTRDIQIDLAPGADTAPKDGRLVDKAEGARLLEHRPVQNRDQLAGALRVHRYRADEGCARVATKKKAVDLWRLVRRRFGPGDRGPDTVWLRPRSARQSCSWCRGCSRAGG